LSFGAGIYDFWLVKTDAEGNMEWNKTYGGGEDEWVFSVVQTSDGGYTLGGYRGVSYFDADCWFVKTDADGNEQWNRTYYGPYGDAIFSVVQTSDGGYTLAGLTMLFFAGDFDFLLIKTDSFGNEQWSETYGGTNDDVASSVVQTSDGGYTLAGSTESFGVGGYDFWLVKTDAEGNMEWNKTYGGPHYDTAGSVVQTVDGGYALAGQTESFGAGNSDFWLVKMAPYHDVVVDVSPSKTVVGQGLPILVNVTVENECFFSETVNVTVYADAVAPFEDEIIIGEQASIHLAVGETQTVQFQWDTTGFSKGNYTISAVASPVSDEIDTANNICTAVVTIAMVGDIVPDGIVDIFDLVAVATWFGSTIPPAPSNSDIIEDKLIDIYDLVTLALHYGETDL
jgi:hypothetical protein